MKRYYLLLIALIIANFGLAQTNRVEMKTAPDFTVTDIDGKTHHLYEYLEAGKTVVIDFSAVWCSPCWQYHKSGVLEKLYEQHGPDGADDFMVLFFESDGNTTLEMLKGQGSGYGDWTEGTNYPMILTKKGEPSYAVVDAYDVEFFPGIYMICPEKKYQIVGQLGTVDAFVDASRDCEGVSIAPRSGFTYSSYLLPNTEVRITDYSKKADTYEWSFPGGSPTSSTEKEPVVSYDRPGDYTITLTTTNSEGSNTLTRDIKIHDSGNVNLYECDFEQEEDLSTNIIGWRAIDEDKKLYYKASHGFETPENRSGVVAMNPSALNPPLDDPNFKPHKGNKFGVVYSGSGENSDWLISSKLRLGDESAISMWVKSVNELFGKTLFEVGVSTTTDALDQFTMISGSDMVEAPGDSWTLKEFDLSTYNNKEVYIAIHVKYAVLWNFFMIDDIKIETKVGLQEEELRNNTAIYPNPAKHEIHITSPYIYDEISLYNPLGQQVLSVKPVGKNCDIAVEHLPQGIYVLKIKGAKGSFSQKIQVKH